MATTTTSPRAPRAPRRLTRRWQRLSASLRSVDSPDLRPDRAPDLGSPGAADRPDRPSLPADLPDAAARTLPPGVEVLPGRDPSDPADAARERLRAALGELYPSVAGRVADLAAQGVGAGLDAWLAVARLMHDAHVEHHGGPSSEARLRALLATLSQALEAQARSSARLAGYRDAELDLPSQIAGDALGSRLWQHYLCPEARLARQALHGEVVADWLTALGELWGAADELAALVERTLTAPPAQPTAPAAPTAPTAPADVTFHRTGGEPATHHDPPGAPEHHHDGGPAHVTDGCDADGDGDGEPLDSAFDSALVRCRVALTRVEELSLW